MDADVRPEGPILGITFLYYRDLDGAVAFYERVLGFSLAIDQGWSKIYCITGAAHLGLVDEARGMHRASDPKPVQICIRVPDVDAWHAYVEGQGVEGLTEPSHRQRVQPLRVHQRQGRLQDALTGQPSPATCTRRHRCLPPIALPASTV